MNQSDSERIGALLETLGCQRTDVEAKADLLVTVACSVRQSAINRIYGKAGIWAKQKKTRGLITILTGCVLGTDKKKLSRVFDLIFDINDLPKLPELLGIDDKLIRPIPDGRYFNIEPKYENNFQAYVPISNGCNNYCAYCVVPYTRGREQSRPAKEIMAECSELIKQGYKEITLLGQNVNSYGHDLTNDLSFPGLLRKIDEIPGKFWLRFTSSHPKDMSDELIDTIASGKNICENVHLPVQSGDNEILKKMNRHYTSEHYLELIRKIKQKIPGVSVSTDVIVGFPGETKKQFNNTAKLFQQAEFDMAYIAQYSPRFGTAAYQLTDNVPKKVKQQREETLTKILKKTARKYNKQLVGKTVEILIESQKKEKLIGKTKTGKTVVIPLANKQPDLIGRWQMVKIIKAQSFGLMGKFLL